MLNLPGGDAQSGAEYSYNMLCQNKLTKIHMPKMKFDEDTEIHIFERDQLEKLDEYFSGTNLELAYLLGRYCGLRINECFGLTWSHVNLDEGTITIQYQMMYQEGIIKLVQPKTRNQSFYRIRSVLPQI